MHVALRIAYAGTRFDAYARDPGAPRSVEGSLEEALRGEGYVEGSLRTGSRTDRGVSAHENVLRVELDRPHLRGLVPAACAGLPDGLWLTAACTVEPDWNPRHAASRTYHYLTPGRGEDVHRMQEACQVFVGKHHFGAFARLEAGRDPVREVLHAAVGSDAGDWRFVVQGRSFLWNQVRRTVDAVLRVGAGEAEVEDVRRALLEGTPHRSFGKAPPGGLVLAAVEHGLVWDASAGTVPRRGVERQWQEAVVRQGVVQSLRGWKSKSG